MVLISISKSFIFSATVSEIIFMLLFIHNSDWACRNSSQNLTTFQTSVTHNFLLQYGVATQFLKIVHNLTGFPTQFTEPKYYISELRYFSSNHMVYFSPHALFSQGRSYITLWHRANHTTAEYEASTYYWWKRYVQMIVVIIPVVLLWDQSLAIALQVNF